MGGVSAPAHTPMGGPRRRPGGDLVLRGSAVRYIHSLAYLGDSRLLVADPHRGHPHDVHLPDHDLQTTVGGEGTAEFSPGRRAVDHAGQRRGQEGPSGFHAEPTILDRVRPGGLQDCVEHTGLLQLPVAHVSGHQAQYCENAAVPGAVHGILIPSDGHHLLRESGCHLQCMGVQPFQSG